MFQRAGLLVERASLGGTSKGMRAIAMQVDKVVIAGDQEGRFKKKEIVQ